MHQSKKTDYVCLNISDGTSFAHGTWRSLWRQWNQLSRLQRNIFSLVILVGLFLSLYIFTQKGHKALPYQEEYEGLVVDSQEISNKPSDDVVKDTEDVENAPEGNIEEPEVQPEKVDVGSPVKDDDTSKLQSATRI